MTIDSSNNDQDRSRHSPAIPSQIASTLWLTTNEFRLLRHSRHTSVLEHGMDRSTTGVKIVFNPFLLVNRQLMLTGISTRCRNFLRFCGKLNTKSDRKWLTPPPCEKAARRSPSLVHKIVENNDKSEKALMGQAACG